MNKYFNKSKLDYPELSIEIDEIIGQTMSQCEIENHPNDSELWDAEQYLNELIERNQEPLQGPTQWCTIKEIEQ